MNPVLKIKNASSAIEFLVVFIVLFLFFLGILDIGLFFRQIYTVQTISDEVLAKLTTERVCTNDADVSEVMADTLNIFYGVTPNFTASAGEGFTNYSSADGCYVFVLSCRNSTTPDFLNFSYFYRGIFFYAGGRTISSNFSSNTTYF